MLRVVIALCFVALALGATVPDATQDSEFIGWAGRIVGGQTATNGQFPYQISLRSTANSHFCGGSLVNNRWIVSAAHCTVGRSGANTVVVVGALSRTTGGVTHRVARIVNHPSYSSQTLNNDISVAQTETVMVFTATVAPIGLGSAFVGGGVSAVASGWGQTSNPGSAAANLQFVALTTLTNADCRSRLSATLAARIFDSVICTFVGTGRGTCMGDSGGPLAVGGNVIGAVSWGIPCAVGSPDVYARISSHRAWIIGFTG